MIRFALICEHAHTFEGWFSSNADYESQVERGLVSCPVCGTAQVEKSLMAPSVSKDGRDDKSASPHSLAMSPQQKDAMARLRKLAAAVRANAEDVGDRFAAEARNIHYGESEARGIFGKASSEEARSLIEEGIEIAPLPDFIDETN